VQDRRQCPYLDNSKARAVVPVLAVHIASQCQAHNGASANVGAIRLAQNHCPQPQWQTASIRWNGAVVCAQTSLHGCYDRLSGSNCEASRAPGRLGLNGAWAYSSGTTPQTPPGHNGARRGSLTRQQLTACPYRNASLPLAPAVCDGRPARATGGRA
jgi:hypothetical protein